METMKAFQNLKIGKAPGEDAIKTDLLKHTGIEYQTRIYYLIFKI